MVVPRGRQRIPTVGVLHEERRESGTQPPDGPFFVTSDSGVRCTIRRSGNLRLLLPETNHETTHSFLNNGALSGVQFSRKKFRDASVLLKLRDKNPLPVLGVRDVLYMRLLSVRVHVNDERSHRR